MLNVLAINCGSSTLKFQLFGVEGEAGESRLAGGLVERIGGEASIAFAAAEGRELRQDTPVPDHAAAARLALEWLGGTRPIDAVGHRVVHGGARFREPALLDGEAVSAVEAVSELAPLHNAPSLQAIRACREALGAAVPMVATFDTAFYRTLPKVAAHYAISWELAARHSIYRYGFHGLAHRSMMERYAEVSGAPVDRLRLITLQLGAGCSATAIDRGRPVDTSMGFTPLEGLVMGTRSGDIDPSVVSFLVAKEGVDGDEVLAWLNTRSGLLGVSGVSADMRDLLEAERGGNERASLAIDLFCYRARRYIGGYLAVLGGADAVVFGGGIGEHSPEVRARICEGLAPLGLDLDGARNVALSEGDGRISSAASPIAVWVARTDEERIIARDTFALVSGLTART